MKNTYCEIILTNRFDLFCSDDDASDPKEAVRNNKRKQQKKMKEGGKELKKPVGARGAEDVRPDKLGAQMNLHPQRGKERQGSWQNIRNQKNQKPDGVVGGAGGNQGKAKLQAATCPNHKNEKPPPGDNDDQYRNPGDVKTEFKPKEMTLDEWKAQKAAVRLKPQYNLRKAGDGEDPARWDKMVALDKGGEAGSAPEVGTRSNEARKASADGKGGRQVFDIEVHFTDNLRGWLGRMRRGRGMGRNGPGGWHYDFGGENFRSSGAGMERLQQDNVRPINRLPFAGAGPDRSYGDGMNEYNWHARAAPKVDDEDAFPSLR
uniref:Hyaluronan/mRNA-binding protein domain-containing protein n=1 Tax=Anopheles atroparvus TaxID=41427 RepID=A0A182IQS1_ANOAO